MFYPTEYKIPEFKSQVQILSKEFWFLRAFSTQFIFAYYISMIITIFDKIVIFLPLRNLPFFFFFEIALFLSIECKSLSMSAEDF